MGLLEMPGLVQVNNDVITRGPTFTYPILINI